MRNRFRNPSLKEPLTRSRRNYRWDIEMGCVYVCVCVYARKTIPIPHGTRERLIEMKPCERNIPWGEFYGGPPRTLADFFQGFDFMQIESPPPINDYDFSGIGLVIRLDRKWNLSRLFKLREIPPTCFITQISLFLLPIKKWFSQHRSL